MGVGIVRSGRRFGVILDREDGERPVPDAFHAAIIEVEVGHLKFWCTWYAGGVPDHGKAVVLGRDQDVA
jgi:hypothetical protein